MTTCIIYNDKTNKTIYFGCDKQFTQYGEIINSKIKLKKLHNKIYLLSAGNMGIIQTISNNLKIKKYKNQNKLIYAKYTMREIQKLLLNDDTIEYDSDGEDKESYTFDISLLLIVHNKIYSCDNNLNDIYEIDDYYAIGSGKKYVLGYINSLRQFNLVNKNIIKYSLKCASKFDSYTGNKFIIKKFKY